MKWIDLGEILDERFLGTLKTGDLLRFEKAEVKVVRKAKGKVWGKSIITYRPEDVAVVDEK